MRIERNFYSRDMQEVADFEKMIAQESATLPAEEVERRQAIAEEAACRFMKEQLDTQLHTGYILNPEKHIQFMQLAEVALSFAEDYGYDIVVSDEPPAASIEFTSAVFMDLYKDSILPQLFALCTSFFVTPTKENTVKISFDFDIYDKFSHE